MTQPMEGGRDTYETIGVGYRNTRAPDARIAERIHGALGGARTVCNVGAGAGSYEPEDADVVAVEPARTMLAQRGPDASDRVVQGVAEQLPFPDRSFEASMAVLTVHHWVDADGGLAELRRVADRTVVFGFDPGKSRRYWLCDYLPMIGDLDDERAPSVEQQADALGARVEVVPIPVDCTDGFLCAWWRRPEAYLDPAVRAAISSLAMFDEADLSPGLERLRADLDSGEWRRRYAELFERDDWDWGYRLFVADGDAR